MCPGVEVGCGVPGERGDKALNAQCRTPPSPATPQRLLQIPDMGRRQPRPGGQDRAEALRAFLDPRGGNYSWQDAHADVERLVGALGLMMEVRGCPLGKLGWWGASTPCGDLIEEDAPPRGFQEEARPGREVQGRPRVPRTPRTHAPAPPQCVTLDKLEALPSEGALVARALELLDERRFWAGVVFLGPEDPADPAPLPGPGHVRIKIRMDIDDVTKTNKIRDRCVCVGGGGWLCGRGLRGRGHGHSTYQRPW